MNENLYHVKCIDFTYDGQGIAKINNKVVFIPSLLKDEEADIKILYRKKDFDVGKIVKITKFSKFRELHPLCPIYSSCGGCSFQNLKYEKELKYKKELAISTLKSIAKINDKKLLNNIKIYGMSNSWTYYRNKIQVPFGYDKQNRLVYGLYRFKSHDIVPINECVISSKEHVEILRSIKKLMLDMDIKAYNEDLRTGVIRHVLIRVAKVTKEIMVVIVVNEKSFKNKRNFIKELVSLNKEITTIIFNYNDKKTNVILGEKEEVVYGKGYIYDYLLNIKFKISSKSFYQINHDQCEKLYTLAIKEAKLNKEDNVIDAYCGVGTISLCVSKHVNSVYGIEIVKEAINDAKENAKINNINNVIFETKDAKNIKFNPKYNIIFLDPPRKGLEKELINNLIKSNIKKIVYISCDVGTLSRDLIYLKEKYQIESINFVDMFPRTYHIETVVALCLKKERGKFRLRRNIN